jgi:predicted nucleotide-binding protein (sugar kinase/HSP70/actin superfamily)
MTLIQKDVPTIFYPSVLYERQEDASAQNHYNCPIVQSYPKSSKIILMKFVMVRLATFIPLSI